MRMRMAERQFNKRDPRRVWAWLAAIAVCASADATPPSSRPSPTTIVGMTAPFETATLAPVQPARIAALAAPEGGLVRKGDIVVQLEERVQAARTEIAKASAETNLNIEHARARWDQAKRNLDRLQKLHGKEFASSKEMADAVSEEQVTRAEYDLAHFNQAQAVRAYQREAAMLEEFRLRAPFDGYVAAHLKRPGESINELEGVVTLAQLDPLKIVLDCPIETIGSISEGARFAVAPVDDRFSPRLGTVVFASRVADGGSQTFRVKLTVDNANAAWPSGLKIAVDFASPVETTGSHDASVKP